MVYRQIGMVVMVLVVLTYGVGQHTELSAQARGGKVVKILTIGNSFAENATTYLEQMAASVPGYAIEVTKANIGGCSLERHSSLIEACEEDPSLKPYGNEFCLHELLVREPYDFVTIQQVSSQSWRPDSFEPYAGQIIQLIRELAPQAQILIHQTWAYDEDCVRLENWDLSKAEMHRRLVESYDKLASDYNLEILPSGEAFYVSFAKDPELNLWKSDNYHANENGCYLAGAVWLGQLLDVSPTKIKFTPEGINRKTALFFRKTAKKTLKQRKKSNVIGQTDD